MSFTLDQPAAAEQPGPRLSVLNEARQTLAGPACLQELVSFTSPESAAVDYLSADSGREVVTYRVLRDCARRLACLLRQHASSEEGQLIIPVVMPQCPELYVSYLAILEAGAGFCPIQPDAPAERMRFVVRDVGAKLVLTVASHLHALEPTLPDVHCQVVSLAQLQSSRMAVPECHSMGSQIAAQHENDIAYVMYTSGSTGLPKGVKIPHRSVVQSLLAHDEHIPAFKRFLQFASPTFDVSVFEIFFPLYRGATVVCCEREHMLADLPGTIRELNVDAVELTPTVAGTLLRTRDAVPGLKTLLTIGEMLTGPVIEEFGGSASRASMLYAMYGPTEAAIHCTLAPKLSASSSIKNIGVPLSTVTAFILSDTSHSTDVQILPVGHAGELAIAGQLACGYLNRPKETAAAFIQLAGFGEVYRTGDRALITAEGVIQILGRISVGQVKLRGQRIELGEIEEVACKAPGLQLAVACVIKDSLTLFCAGASNLAVQDIETTCAAWLPRFMRPNETVVLPEGLPRLSSGKVDRRKLEIDFAAGPVRQLREQGEVDDDIKIQITNIVGRELRANVGFKTSLWTYGLDSLKAIRIAAELRRLFPQATMTMLLDSESVDDLCRKLTVGTSTHAEVGLQEGLKNDSAWTRLESQIRNQIITEPFANQLETVLPCSLIQTAMLMETAVRSWQNFNTIVLQHPEQISSSDVCAALSQIAADNQIMRSGFIPTTFREIPFVRIVWQSLSFDGELSLLHPLRVEAGKNGCETIVEIHHAIYDGWSWELVVSDMNQLLSGQALSGRPQFSDLCEYTARAHATRFEIDQTYWTDLLQDVQPHPFPNLCLTRTSDGVRRSCHRSSVAKSSVLGQLCASLGISRQSIMLAAFVLLMGAYCDTSDVICGVVASGREQAFPNIDQILGPCLSTYPLRIDLSSVESIRDLLRYVHQANIGYLKHNSLSLGQIKQASRLPASQNLFDTLFIWQEGPNTSKPNSSVKTLETSDALHYTLILEAGRNGEEVWTKLVFDDSKIPADHAVLLLQQITSFVTSALSDVRLLLADVWTNLPTSALSISSSKSHTSAESRNLRTAIESFAIKCPERVAVEVVTDVDIHTQSRSIQRLSYQELYSRSAVIARHMVDSGSSKPNELICIIAEKSIDLYVVILAVVTSGAGFLCIDPAITDTEIQQAVRDARSRFVVTSQPGRLSGLVSNEVQVWAISALVSSALEQSVKQFSTQPDQNLACAIFTSGTTGNPKLVRISQRSLLHHTDQMIQTCPCEPGSSRLLQFSFQGGGTSISEIFWAWHAGMTLCAAKCDNPIQNIEKLVGNMSITHLILTPPVANLIDPCNVPTVKVLLTTGDLMHPKVFNTWKDRGFYHAYGQSETTNICTIRRVVSSDSFVNHVGHVLGNNSVFVCTRQTASSPAETQSNELSFKLLPKGAIGEIWVGGDQVSQGYFADEVTTKSWLKHPEYGMIYKSSDLGRILVDDSLIVFGRDRSNTKLLAESGDFDTIDTILLDQEQVKDAETLDIDSPQPANVVSFICVESQWVNKDQVNLVHGIFQALQDRLPDHTIPHTIIPIEYMPLTRHGKVDCEQLEALYANISLKTKQLYSQSRRDESNTSSLSMDEAKVAKILSEVSHTPLAAFTHHTSFYKLGLDSLNSIAFVQALKASGFIQVDVSTVLKNASVARLTPLIRRQAAIASTVQRKPEGKFDAEWVKSIRSKYVGHGFTVSKILPCTSLQESMLLAESNTEHTAYQNHLTWKLRTSIEAIRQAWIEMVNRHDLLRTAFVETHDIRKPFAQVVLGNYQLPWTDTSGSGGDAELNADLELPPYRLQISNQLGTEGPLLALTIHHAMYDADAMSVLLGQIEDLICRRPLENPYQFTAYIDHMENMDMKKADSFWATTLGQVKPSRMQDLMAFSDVKPRQGVAAIEELRSTIGLEHLEKVIKNRSTRLLPLLQAALVRLLSYYLQEYDVCFGNVSSGRNLPIQGVQHIIGPCFNTLPVRMRLTGRQANQDLVDNLHRQNLEAMEYQPSSLRRIQKNMSPDGKMLFDVILLLQQPSKNLEESIWTLEEDRGNMNFPYILEIIPSRIDDALVLRLHHEKCSRKSASQFLKSFDSLLNHTVYSPHALAIEYPTLEAPSLLPKRQVAADDTLNPPENHLEQDSTNVEQEVLSVLGDFVNSPPGDIDRSTTIFRLGLDSIDAVQIASHLRMKGYLIHGADILENPSIRAIVKHCEANAKASRHKAIDLSSLSSFDTTNRRTIIEQCPVDPNNLDKILPCTPTQSGILSQFLGSEGALYYNRTRFLLKDDIDLDYLKQCWKSTMMRHIMLRTGFWHLENARYPFAMTVYKKECIDLPWTETDLLPGDSLYRSRRVLKNLHQPCWEIVVQPNGSKRMMDVWMLHAIYDARSLQIILADVATSYNTAVKGLEPLSVEAALCDILSSSQANSEAKQFWTDMGSDLEATKFPDLNIYRQPVQRLASCSITSSITPSFAQGQCSSLGVSLQTVGQAAWARLLAAYCGQQKVTFGVILSGRTFGDRELNDVAFPCINVVPFAVELTDDDRSLLNSISQRSARLMRHQHIPLTTIKRLNSISGELFDTVFVLQKFIKDNNSHDLWTVIEDEASGEYTASLEIIPGINDYRFQLTYRQDIIPEQQASIILREFEMILLSLLSEDAGPPKSQARSLLSVLPPRDAIIPTAVNFLHELVEQTVQRQPATIALEFVTKGERDELLKQTWTYMELNNRGNQVANLLIQNGVEVGQLVAVCFDKCPEASFAILGILKAGCTYLTLDPDAPEARRQFILKDASCQIVLTTRNKLALFETCQVVALALDDERSLGDVSLKQPALKGVLTKEHACYCLYTSGTTGTPKGCLISHASAVQAMLSFSRIFEGRWIGQARWLQFAAFHFDVSVLEQYWSWHVGICVTSMPRDLLFEDLPGMIHKLGITHLDLTPSLARLLTPDEVPNLREGVFIVGGEQVRQDILDVWGDVGCLFNFYGPSEVTIGCTVHPNMPRSAKPTNIGKQWDNVGSLVLKLDSTQPVVRGGIGELCLSGPLVGQGYLNRPDLTDQKFCFLQDYGMRIYRSGDLVRMLHDDSFEFLGRIDDQVKLRGQRLEIGEINHVIGTSSGRIADVSTLVLKHRGAGKEQLVAFFSASARRGRKLNEPNLLLDKQTGYLADVVRKHCASHLPIYMVPTYFVGIDFMPLSANNKADHSKLKQLFQKASMGDIGGGHGPKGPGTARLPSNIDHLTKILAKYLDIDVADINPDSSLFELGLDSISVIGLSKILKREGFPRADVPTIMGNSVLLDLAEAVETESSIDQNGHDTEVIEAEIKSFALKHQMSISQDIGVPTHDIEAIVPCTPLQQGMVSKVVGSEKAQRVPYFGSFSYQLHNSTSVDKLENAWEQSARQLGILRTRFVPTEDGCAQVILKKHKLLSLHLRGNVSAKDVSDAFDDWVNKVKKFGRSLPWQICFAHTDNGVIHMAVFLFHGLYDGVGLPLLLQAVEKNYASSGNTTYAHAQFHTILPYGPLSRPRGAEKFWQKTLAQISLLNLSSRVTKSSKTIRIADDARYPNLNQICSQLSVTTPAVFHAAWLYALYSRYKINPTIGIVSSGRLIAFEGVENIIGPMLNTVPCVVYTSRESPGIYDLIHACHDFNVNSLPFQHTSIRNIAKWIKAEGRGELFDSLLVFQKKDRNEVAKGELWTGNCSHGEPDYPLNIEIAQTGDGGDISITVVAKECEHLRKQDIKTLLTTLKLTVERICSGDDFCLPRNFDHASELSLQRQSTKDEQVKIEKIKKEEERARWEGNVLMTKIRGEIARLADIDIKDIHADSPTLFELGLDSIDALKLAARLKSVDVVISVSRILKNPTVSGIAELCKPKKTSRHHENRDVSIHKQQEEWRQSLQKQGVKLESGDEIFPVTPMQEGLLLDFEKYYHVTPYQLRLGTDVKLLSDALQHLSRTIPILKTRFFELEDTNIADTFVQVIQHEASTKIQRMRLKRKTGVKKLVQQLRDDAVHLGLTGQFLQICLATVLQDGSTILLLGLPHAIYDGWSLQLIHAAINDCYDGRFDEHALQPFVTYLDEGCKQAKDEGVALFWQNYLSSAKPTLFQQSCLEVSRQAMLLQQQSRIPRFAALELCKSTGITPQSLGLTCWALLLAHNTRTLDVLHGVVLSGRISEGADHLIFPTFNTAIFRTQLQFNVSGEQLLKQVHNSAYDVMDNHHYPLKSNMRYIKHSGSDVFNTLFTYQKDAISNETSSKLYDEYDLGSLPVNPPYAVNVEMTEKDGQTWWTCAVQDNVASAAQVKKTIDLLDDIVEFLLKSTQTPVVTRDNDGTKICDLSPIQLKQEEIKIDDASKKLAATSLSNSASSYGMETPWSADELKIRTVLAQVANVDEAMIEKNTGIFHLGLDSVSAIKIVSRLRRAGLRIPVSELIRAQTLGNIARLVSSSDSSAITTSSPRSEPTTVSPAERVLKGRGISLAAVETILPAAAGQVYMLDAWRASGGHLFYADFWFQATAVTKETFGHAFKILTKMVPTFRTSFIDVKGKTFAVTFKADTTHSVSFPWALETVQQGDKVLAKLRIHHALYDAVGLHIIVLSLTTLCRDLEARLTLHTDFRPFLRLTRELNTDLAGHRQRFWTTYLGVADAENKTHLVGSFSAPREQKFVPNLLRFETLKPTLKKHGVSIQTLFFAAYAHVHARLLAQARSVSDSNIDGAAPSHVVLGIYIANRFLDVEGIESLVGPTFNILPLKIKTVSRSASSLIETARQIQRDIQVISRSEHSGASLRDIHGWTGMKLDGYMNFLRLPDDQDEGDIKTVSTGDINGHEQPGKIEVGASHEKIKITHAEGESLYDVQSTLSDEAKQTFERKIEQHDTTDPAPISSYAVSPYLVDNTKIHDLTGVNWEPRPAQHSGVQSGTPEVIDDSSVDPLTTTNHSGRDKKGASVTVTFEDDNDRADSHEDVTKLTVQGHYQHEYIIPAIDIEARVMPDENLAIGVFAPSDMFEQYNMGDNDTKPDVHGGNHKSGDVGDDEERDDRRVGVDWIIYEVKDLLVSVVDG